MCVLCVDNKDEQQHGICDQIHSQPSAVVHRGHQDGSGQAGNQRVGDHEGPPEEL